MKINSAPENYKTGKGELNRNESISLFKYKVISHHEHI